MDCQTFRDQHLFYTDSALPPIQAAAMRAHAEACARCAHLHVALRRGLMVVKSLPSITPSAGFGARLRAVYSAHATVGDARPQIGARTADVRPRLSLSR
jgi:anti-sigma factor RsiW